MQTPARVLLVGAYGYGRIHRARLLRLGALGTTSLVGLCEPRPLDAEVRAEIGGVPVSADLDELLDRCRPEITVIATPIHTHVPLAVRALRAGSAVLVEKPPAARLADFTELLRTVELTGRPCQIGFQSLGSAALPAALRLVGDGILGDLRGIGAAGTWVRTDAYYARTPWAGRMELDGTPVTDGALTNPFAHALASALRLHGAETVEDVAAVEVERFRARPIEADDTVSVRVRTRDGGTVAAAATLCAEQNTDPYLELTGSRGRAVVHYTEDRITVHTTTGTSERTYPRTDLLENLIEHLADPEVPLLAAAHRCGAFMAVLEAIRLAPPPRPIPEAHLRWEGEGPERRAIIAGVDGAVARCARELALFGEAGPDWARSARRGAVGAR
ncbi:Gfo/Idh/MocA family protein [Allonocardiopsis opalescens]|uniref:Putative dehydrogenase n=1 Tax=Allonocardiopsis opalescens TaxID=1144618 RepID=A0A2T0QAA4_9ACTN|nr:Gfo/Idh/MocA family oxidoreductase [Allonocardiopsis opalescens]PRY00846.1 putative dehydrogenase [Allonocardiopsis opalescens]